MKTFLYILLSASLLVAGERSYAAYQWKHYADERAFLSERAGIYLFGPSGVVGPDGKSLSRQQLIDAYLHQVIEKSPDYKFVP